MALKKVTSANHLPGEGDDRFPVYSKQLNEALKSLNGESTPEPIAMKTPYTAITANKTLSISDSGGLFMLSGSAITITLPTMTSAFEGFTCTLISGDNSEHVLTGGATLIHGVGVDAATGLENTAARTTLTLQNGAIGDKFDISSDGTNWYVYWMTTNGVTAA